MSKLNSLILPLTLCTLLEAKVPCTEESHPVNKKIKGCMIDASVKSLDVRSQILNRLTKASEEESKNSISKERSVIAIEKLVYAAGKINLTKAEIALTQLDKEINHSKKNKQIEIINRLVYKKKNIKLTKEEMKLTQLDKEIKVPKNKRLHKLVTKMNKKNNTSIIKSNEKFILIKVKKGDTLQSLANHYYGSRDAYKIIYRQNKDKIGKNLKIFSNTVLIIPNIKRGGKIIDS